ncbi:MAG: hypothetical protein WBA10_16415 [Elainellaceae cyanobacterium]
MSTARYQKAIAHNTIVMAQHPIVLATTLMRSLNIKLSGRDIALSWVNIALLRPQLRSRPPLQRRQTIR